MIRLPNSGFLRKNKYSSSKDSVPFQASDSVVCNLQHLTSSPFFSWHHIISHHPHHILIMLTRALVLVGITCCSRMIRPILGFTSSSSSSSFLLSSASKYHSRFNNGIFARVRSPMTTTFTSLSSTSDASSSTPAAASSSSSSLQPLSFVVPSSSWSELLQACEATPVGQALRQEKELRQQGKGSAHVQNQLRLFDSDDQPPKITLYRDHAGWWYVLYFVLLRWSNEHISWVYTYVVVLVLLSIIP